MCLATMAYVYAACAVRVTIFSMGGKFQPVSNLTWLHNPILAARSYALLMLYEIISLFVLVKEWDMGMRLLQVKNGNETTSG